MLKKSKSLSQIKKDLKYYINNKDVLDVILFGSFVKGKQSPSDIDVAIITEKDLEEIENYHISFIRPEEFFINIPSLVITLFKEGYSIKTNQYFSEKYEFSSRVMFSYELSGLSSSDKVKVVNFLRGTKNSKGIVEENNSKWIANGIFSCPVDKDYLFDKYFIENKIKFRKYYILMH